MTVLFAVYLALLAWTVLWKLEPPYVGGGTVRQVKLVPFAATAHAGASAPLEVTANVLLFLPVGLYLGLLAPRLTWPQAMCAVAGTSLAFEVVQYVLALGISDIGDLLANTAGGLAGIGLVALVRRRLRARTVAVMSWICVIATVLTLLAAGLVVASPIRFGGPRDDVGRSTHPVPQTSASPTAVRERDR